MEQEKQTQPEQKKKRLSTPLLIFIILMAVTLTLCAVVAGIWLHGRSSLRNQGAAPTDTPALLNISQTPRTGITSYAVFCLKKKKKKNTIKDLKV